MKTTIMLAIMLLSAMSAAAQNVTVHARERAATEVFRELMRQTGKNFVYSSDLLKDMKVTVDADNKPLKRVLDKMFKDKDIYYKIKGNDVVLKRSRKVEKEKTPAPHVSRPKTDIDSLPIPKMLDEIVITSRLEEATTKSVEIGAKKMTAREIINTPVLLGESDVIKALTLQPGIAEGTEGLAGMHVHGGNNDENLYMLDNVPLYQVNHFGGLFSAFNPEAIDYIDFFKSSIPARFDGRLSSFLDVRTRRGIPSGHHGSAKLGLTSGSFNLTGPIGKKTSYLVALRRSWMDVITIPALAIANSNSNDEKIRFNYYFMDLNAKVNHRFSDRASLHASVYFGDDRLKTGEKGNYDGNTITTFHEYEDKYTLHWGNLVAQTNFNYRLTDVMTSEFTGAFTKYFSGLDMYEHEIYKSKTETLDEFEIKQHTSNDISDWILRADFDWNPSESNRVRFGANQVIHTFLPTKAKRSFKYNDQALRRDVEGTSYTASETNAYIEDDVTFSEKFRANTGLHGTVFHIDGKTRFGWAPRASVSYMPTDDWAVKASYARTNQYVHQLQQSYLSLPTDQWIPISGDLKPQTADKVSIGGYWNSPDGRYSASVEGYWKEMRNLIDYLDEYYLEPPLNHYRNRLTSGKGTSKGIDIKIEKTSGKFTGHIAYTLAWTDRTFKEKNQGMTFPARFDNRHTINVLVNWNISEKVQINAAWTGHSGNRFTLLTQMWESPEQQDYWAWPDAEPLRTSVNNYQLPFYHRLDLACTVHNKRGYWTFSLYNAYCNRNTVAIVRDEKMMETFDEYGNYGTQWAPVFKKFSLLPVIPSISYTWQF